MSEEIKETYIRMLSHTIHYDCCYDADADNDFKKISDYITNLQQKVEQLEKELKEANESITWWSNRFKAVERDNKQLENIRKEAMEWVKNNRYYFPKPDDLLNVLNKGSDKE